MKYSVVAIKAFNFHLMMCIVHAAFIFLEFDWVTLPCAVVVHLLNYVHRQMEEISKAKYVYNCSVTCR